MIQWILSMSLFLAPTDPQLNEESLFVCPCDIKSEMIQSLIDQMIEVAMGATADPTKPILVGLAAPQIGVLKRIILVDTRANGEFSLNTIPHPPNIREFIDPTILWKSDEIEYGREGCFSTGRICGIVPRSKKVILRSYDRLGKLNVEEFVGYVARIIQHEIDHLDGIRFPDRIIEDASLHWVEIEEIPKYRIDWANWSKTIPRSEWEKMKKGSF